MNGLLLNIGQLATCPAAGQTGDIGLIPDAALAWSDGRIAWAGPMLSLPAPFQSWLAKAEDASGALVVPGLVDCHTHLAFAGWRADEFVLRCRGATYQEIAASGGGIMSTVQRTRAATEDELYARARGFLEAMTDLGITTVECKSGYGLTTEDELKLLRVYRRLRREGPQTVVSTFLGAHVVPPEFRSNRADYVRLVCEEMIPRLAAEHLADFCDVFIEDAAFTPAEARKIFAAAEGHGLRPKLHADQLTDTQGAALAAEVGAVSADHLECARDDGLKAMAERGVVAVILPLATTYLRARPLAARRCFEAGVSVAVATDFNPGSAPSYHLPLALTLACTLNRLTPAQALQGATIHAARALGRDDVVGSLECGKRADFVVLEAESVEHWIYHLRPNAVRSVYIEGRRIR
jgi:imidazolonepropionase